MVSCALLERKAALVARCEAERVALAEEAGEFRYRVRWIELGWDTGRVVLPRLKFLAPVLGLVLARNLPRGARVIGVLQTAWQLGRRLVPMLSGWRAALGR